MKTNFMKKIVMFTVLFVLTTKSSFAQLPIPYYANDNLPKKSKNIHIENGINSAALERIRSDKQKQIPTIYAIVGSKADTISKGTIHFNEDNGAAILDNLPDGGIDMMASVKTLTLNILATTANGTPSISSTLNVTPSDTTNDINSCQAFNIFKKYIKMSDSDQTSHFNLKNLLKFVYGQDATVEAFQSASFQSITSNTKIINVQLASFIFANSFRLGVGTSFNSTGDTAKDNSLVKEANVQKIIAGGGTINFNFSCPLFFHRSTDDNFHVGLTGMDIVNINPNFDSTGNNTVASGFSNNFLFTDQIGFLFHLDVGSVNASNVNARLSLDVPCTYVFGSPYTYQKLGIPDFSLVNPQFGIVIGDLLSLHISWPALSTAKMIQREPVVLTLQFSPSKIASSVGNSGS